MQTKLGLCIGYAAAALFSNITSAEPLDTRMQRNLALPEMVMPQRDLQLQRDMQLRQRPPVADQLKLQKELMQRNEQLKTGQPSSTVHRVTQGATHSETARTDPNNNLTEMSRQLDLLDQKEFKLSLERASDCIRKENWQCADIQLQQAKKLANSAQEQRMLRQTENTLLNEKMRAQNRNNRQR